MSSPQDVSKPRRRWRTRLLLALAAVLGSLLLVALALPWLVSLFPVQRLLESQSSRILAPGAVRFDRLRVSWTRPTEIDGLKLIDHQGDPILLAPHAVFSWSLWELLLTRPRAATLTLETAAVDLERSAAGKVDLLETLDPILDDRATRTIHVRVSRGKLRFRQEGLVEPFLAEPADIDLDLTAYPEPIAWDLKLKHAPVAEGGPEGTVRIQGSAGRTRKSDGQPEEIQLTLQGSHWPWKYTSPGLLAEGVFGGLVLVQEKASTIALEGDVQLSALHVGGEALQGDELRLDTVQAKLKVQQDGALWTAERFQVTSPLGSLEGSGVYPPAADRGATLAGKIDLAALAQQLPRTLRLRKDLTLEGGTVELNARVQGEADSPNQSIQARATLTGLSARHGQQTLTLRDPAVLDARLKRGPRSVVLERLDVQTPFLTATGRGDVDSGIDVTATVDLDAATRRLRDWVDLGTLELAGRGKINAKYKRIENRYEAAAQADFQALRVAGAPVVGPIQRDALTSALKLQGGSDASGLPESVRNLELTARANTDELTVKVTRDPAAGPAGLSLTGRTQLVLDREKQTATADVQARWTDKEVTLDQILLTLAPVVGPGGQFLPTEPARWSASGGYDIANDLLTITSRTGAAGGAAPTLPVWPSRIRASQLRTPRRAAVEVNLEGELGSLFAAEKQSRLSGRIAGLVQVKPEEDGWDLGLRVQLRELAQTRGKSRQVLADELVASLRGKLAQTLEKLEFSELSLATPYGQVEGSGLVSDLRAEPRFDLRGKVSPDWEAMTRLLASKIEPRASVSGSPRAWRLSGKLPRSGVKDMLATLESEVGVNLQQVDVFGMRLGQAAVVVRSSAGRLSIDPIDSTLNAGRLHLEPEVVKDRQGAYWLHMGPSSGLLDAVVNDEVSHRVLSFAAPILDQATRVRGRVSLALSDAYIPLSAGPQAQVKVDGDVLFDSVEFMPGPLADQIIGIFRQERRPLLVLRDPVSVRIVGQRVYQEGLLIPLGNVAVIGMDGWVDFDQNLNLVASLAMIPPRRNIPVLSDLLANTQLQLPITGTFQKPRLDGAAIADRFKDMGVNMLDSVIGFGANGLNRLLRGRAGPPVQARDFFPPFSPPGDEPLIEPSRPPRDPQANRAAAPGRGDAAPAPPPSPPPPPPRPGADAGNPDDDIDRPPGPDGDAPQTLQQRQQQQREERKQRRLERRNERRLKRGLPPE